MGERGRVREGTRDSEVILVITGAENGSPDMIPVAFERKFNEKFDEIPLGIYRPHILEIFQYWKFEG